MQANDQTDGMSHLARPVGKQVRWQDCEVGAIFHVDISIYQEGGRTDHASIHQTWAPEVYHPDRLDTDNRTISVVRRCRIRPYSRSWSRTAREFSEVLRTDRQLR